MAGELVHEDATEKPFLVVTGSSAGGIEALLALVGGLPGDFAAPIVIAQHLDPAHPSRLADILARRSPIPVHTVTERAILNTSAIYVVPPGHDIVIVDGAAATFVETRPGPKPSVDRLFSSAAEKYGDGLIAIVFSGMGTDGLAGVRDVKAHGGTVVIQEPRTASHPSMPLAIPPTLVDLAARPEAMGSLLHELMRGTRVPDGTAEQNVLRALLTQLRDRSGIDFLQYKTPTIMRRLSRLMVAAGVDKLSDYVRHLQAHPEGYQRLVGAFLIKMTEFFRDAALFDELKSHVLPRLIAEAEKNGNELRIWSAGTSTGEEAYSLAILCAELLRGENVGVSVRIFATDLDEEAIAFARRGVYGREALRRVPQAWIERYFVRMGDQFEVCKPIRNMTVFGAHDLGQRAPFPRIDLCMCRNVLMYFTRELQTRALQLFAFSLRDGGFLVLGKAESTTPATEYFRPVDATLKIYQRQGERILIPPTRIKDDTINTEPIRDAIKSASQLVQSSLQRSPDARQSLHELIGFLVTNSPLGVVVVDRRYDIVSINSAARALLDIHGVGVGEDLVHLVRQVDTTALRDLIDAAFGSEHRGPRVLAAAEDETGSERWLRIAVYGDRDAVLTTMDLVVLIVTDATEEVVVRRALETSVKEQEENLTRLTARVDELTSRQRVLLQANDELTVANGELRSVNEQLLINAEEAASANEEIETLNEEMQATNEELETLNEELQATVEELNTTNDELEARGHELERMNEAREAQLGRLESERRALTAALQLIPDDVVVVGNGNEVLFSTDNLAEWLARAVDRWWEKGDSAVVDGRTLNFTVQEAVVESQRFQLIRFRSAKER